MGKIDVASIDLERIEANDYGVEEKEVTSYAFRRNFATRCFNHDLSETEIQYVMGHKIRDIRYCRVDFIDEAYQYDIYKGINDSSINDYYFN